MESRKDIETEIEILLGHNLKPEVAKELYEYFESELKPKMDEKNYKIYENKMNDTITLYFESDELTDDQLIMILGILKY